MSVAGSSATAAAKRTQQSRGVGYSSREISKVVGAETVRIVEGNMCGVAMRDADAPPRSKTPITREQDSVGTERSHVRPCGLPPLRSASGRRGAVADDERA